ACGLRSKPDRRRGNRCGKRASCCRRSTRVSTRQTVQKAAARAGVNTSAEANNIARRIATPSLVEIELLERRLVARNKQQQRILAGGVDMLEPGTTGHRERIELVPVEPLSVDDRMALALKWGDEQTCCLTHWFGALARSQHLHKERY